jgi:hypothetical protein
MSTGASVQRRLAETLALTASKARQLALDRLLLVQTECNCREARPSGGHSLPFQHG